MLKGEGLFAASLVDTLRLARSALRLPSYSLASVAAHLFGIELDKSFQKSNWRRRPLTRAQLDYAATDAFVSLRVYEELQKILAGQGRFEDALRFATIAQTSREESIAGRKRRAPQPLPRPLTPDEKRALLALKKWRLEKSFEARVPAYMICPDRTLEHLVMERPETLDALREIHGLGASRIERFGAELLKALQETSVGAD
jgi:ribonuclease D